MIILVFLHKVISCGFLLESPRLGDTKCMLSLVLIIRSYRVTDEALIAESSVWPIYILIYFFLLLLKTISFILFAITAAVVMCDGRKSFPVQHE